MDNGEKAVGCSVRPADWTHLESRDAGIFRRGPHFSAFTARSDRSETPRLIHEIQHY